MQPTAGLASGEDLDFLTFHRDAVRHAHYEAPGEPVFDEPSGMWMVTDPLQALDVLAQPGLEAVSVEFDGVERRFDIDLTFMKALTKRVPLYLEGEAHAAARRSITERIVARRGEIRAFVEEKVGGYFAPLGRPGTVEVVSEVARPMIYGFLEAFTGIDLNRAPPIDLVSMVFDGGLSLTRRRAIFSQIAELGAYLREPGTGGIAAEDPTLGVVLTMFGKDPLIHSFGESIRWLVERHPSARFSEFQYPESLPQTGVPYVERIATKGFTYRNANVAAGQRVRVFVQGFGYLDDLTQLHRYFGARSHVCPGRPVSIELWRKAAETLASFATRPTISRYEMRTDNYVFTGPSVLQLEIAA